LVITWSRNSCTFSCWREVARMLRMPVSGLAITEAASRKVAAGAAAGVAGVGAAPGCAGAVVEGAAAAGCAAAPGRTLSVSCRISLMLAISVSQNLLAEIELMVAVELFCAPACWPEPAPGWVPLTCVDTVCTLRASRERFT
jgi:hypothetical protein